MTKHTLRTFVNILIIGVLLLGVLGAAGLQSAEADGGAYTIKFAAADPVAYIPPVPYPGLVTPIIGRGDGDTQIPSAWYTNPNTNTKTAIESLNPRQMALCQVVPFEFLITVGTGAEANDEPITFVAGWSTVTTNNSSFGFDPAHGVLAAFVDTGDGSYIDPGTDASVSFSSAVVGDEIQGTFTVSGLDANDVVVVEVWMVLQCTLPSKVVGNVSSRLINAYTAAGDAISTGNQTVPLLQVGDLLTQDVDLSIVKNDGDYKGLADHPVLDPYLSFGDTFWYELIVSNTYLDTIANQVIVTDTLDPNLSPLDASCTNPATTDGEICANFEPDYGQICTWDSSTNIITCNLGAVVEGESHRVTFPVVIGMDTPTAGMIEIADSCTQDDPEGLYDICNVVSVTTVSDEIDPSDNSASEPKDIGVPTAVDLLSFDALRKPRKAILTWETANEMDNVGFNIYRSGFVDGVLKKRNAEIIPVEAVGTTMGAVYEFIDTPLKPWKTYFYWLESVDNEGNTTLSDPIKVKPPR